MAMAPNFFGGGNQNGGNNSGDEDDQNSQGNQDNQNLDDSGDPIASALAGIYGADEDEGDGDGNDGDDQNQNQNQNDQNNNQNNNQNGKKETPEQQLARSIQQMIAGHTVAEDLIPADFNPADPKQLRDLLGKTQQQSIAVAVQAAFLPMQQVMKQFSTDMRAEFQSAIKQFGSGRDARSTLESVVPEINSPEYGGLVQSMFDQAIKRKGATPKTASDNVRKALDAMGINKANQGSGGGGDSFTGGFKTGKSALDVFAPMPQQNQQRNSQGNNRR